MFSIIHAVEVAYKYSAIYIVDPVSILASPTVPLGCCTCFIISYLLIVLFKLFTIYCTVCTYILYFLSRKCIAAKFGSGILYIGLLIMLMSGQNCCVRDRDDSGTVICPGSVVTWTLVRYRVVTWTLDKVASRAVLRPGKGCVRDSDVTWTMDRVVSMTVL